MKDFYQFDCPCCGKQLEFDPRSQRARAAKPKETAKPKDLDTLLTQQKGERKRLDSIFGDAFDEQRKEKETLDNLFESAKENAKDDKDTRPHRPFDLD
ncbi:MAG: hypothetical protein IPM13_18350 [Phycisphaerales bacterium]|nr:hypothetical protein [Phycisphaerales bacterium]